MTGAVGILLALVAGWTVSGRRSAAVVVVLPFLVVLGFQTWYIASGRATSPPSTVQFPGLFGYYLVQVIILALALGAADQVRVRRVRGAGSRAAAREAGGRQTRIALVANGILSAVVVVVFFLADGVFDPAPRIHHAASGTPPLLGFLGIGLSAVVFAALGLLNLRSRRAGLTATNSPSVSQ